MNKLTTDEFVEKAVSVHGKEYIYSKTKYERSNQKVIITCRKHGDFKKTPNAHLNGQGCQKCGNSRSGEWRAIEAQRSFREKAERLHRGKYDYSLVDYASAKKAVTIICPVHGEFYQKPANHLAGNGCKACGVEVRGLKSRRPVDLFIEESRRSHGEKYEYDESSYYCYSSKVRIKCKVHGWFYQHAGNHARGAGCAMCAGSISLNKEEFKRLAKLKHGDLYDYSNVDYSCSHSQVTIICRIHGAFSQAPNSHLSGRGCPACGRAKQIENYKLGVNEFISRSKALHGDRYDYSLVDYKTLHHKVNIICPDHGPFWQNANSHMRCSGCPECPPNARRFNDPCSIYIMSAGPKSKIGISIEPTVRVSRLIRKTPFKSELYSQNIVDTWFVARKIESEAHRHLAAKNCGYKGFDGSSEWFDVTADYAESVVKYFIESHNDKNHAGQS